MSDTKNLLRWYTEMGIDTFLSEKPINHMKDSEETFILKHSIPKSNLSRDIANRCNSLQALEQAVKEFDGCEIKKGATNTVFKDGNPNSKVMLIGEAPGASEDEQGIPFCGPSGKLLNNILLAIGLKREDVYITNTVFWRPPGNRRPTGEEIHLCRPFVEKHVALVAPRLIILVGNTAVESLLDLKVSMHSLRGRYFDYSNQYLANPIKAAVIFHPAYLLRQGLKKKDMWFDILKLKKEFLS